MTCSWQQLAAALRAAGSSLKVLRLRLPAAQPSKTKWRR